MAQPEEIYNLEISLLAHSTRTSQGYLNQIIADNFFEFGSSGHVWTKEDLLKALPSEKPGQFKISDFQFIELNHNISLLNPLI